jgi:hypothetical protein
MADATRYGDPNQFDVDLHSIYAAYLYVAPKSAVR